MLRTTCVRLNDPSDAQVRVAMSLPYLNGLIIGGGEYDLEQLASLPNCDAMTVLHLTGRELNDATLSRIRLMDNLRSLNFQRTNMSHTAVEQLFADRPVAAARLKAFNLVDSGVDLKGLSNSKALASMVSLESLGLPCPLPGNEADFTLPPMPMLSSLSFVSHDRGKNASLMKIGIADCPELSSLSIEVMQKASLNLARLPKLKTIVPHYFKMAMRLDPCSADRGYQIAGIALANFHLGKFEESASLLKEATQLQPTVSINFALLAACYAHLGKIDSAREAIARYGQLSTVDVRNRTTLFKRPEHRQSFLDGISLCIGQGEERASCTP